VGACGDRNGGVENAGLCKGIKVVAITEIRHTLKEENYDLDDFLYFLTLSNGKLNI
jgi:hypothetical protein